MYTQTTTGNDSGYRIEERIDQAIANAHRDMQEVPIPSRSEREEEELVCRPSRAEMLRDYQINIEFLTIGCIVSVGCKRIPFTSVSEAMKAINEYVEQPYEMKQKWEKLFEQNK